jgi:hypothetical protein
VVIFLGTHHFKDLRSTTEKENASASPAEDLCCRLGLALLTWWSASAVYFDGQDAFLSSVCEVRALLFEISNSDEDCVLPFAMPDGSKSVPFSFPMVPNTKVEHGVQGSAWIHEEMLALWVSNAASPDLVGLQFLTRVAGVHLRIVAMVGGSASAHDATAGLFFKDQQAKASQHEPRAHKRELSWSLGEAYRLGFASLMVQLRAVRAQGAAVRLLRIRNVETSLGIRHLGSQRAVGLIFPEVQVHSPSQCLACQEWGECGQGLAPESTLFTEVSLKEDFAKNDSPLPSSNQPPASQRHSIPGKARPTTTFLFIAGLEGTGHHLFHQLWTNLGVRAATGADTGDEACSAKLPRICIHRKLSIHLQSMFGTLGNSMRQKHAMQFQRLVAALTAADAQSGKERKVYILNTFDVREMLSFPFGNRLATAEAFPGASCFRLQGRAHCIAHPDLILLAERFDSTSQLKCILLTRQLGASVVSTSVNRHFGGQEENQAHVLAASYRLMVYDLRLLFPQAEGEVGGSTAFLKLQYENTITDSGRAAASISSLLNLSPHESDILALEFRKVVSNKISHGHPLPAQNAKKLEVLWKEKLGKKAMQIVQFVSDSLACQFQITVV